MTDKTKPDLLCGRRRRGKSSWMVDIAREFKLPLFQPGQPSQMSDTIKENQKQLLRCWPKSFFAPDYDIAAVERIINRQRTYISASNPKIYFDS